MDSYILPFAIRDALLCLVFLVGIFAGIFAIRRNRKKVGMLVITSFVLLGIDPLSEFILFNLIAPNFNQNTEFAVLNWTYVCISGFVDVVGFLGLMAALYFAIQPEQKETDSSSNEVIYSPDH